LNPSSHTYRSVTSIISSHWRTAALVTYFLCFFFSGLGRQEACHRVFSCAHTSKFTVNVDVRSNYEIGRTNRCGRQRSASTTSALLSYSYTNS
jgi:hypothetical protein